MKQLKTCQKLTMVKVSNKKVNTDCGFVYAREKRHISVTVSGSPQWKEVMDFIKLVFVCDYDLFL